MSFTLIIIALCLLSGCGSPAPSFPTSNAHILDRLHLSVNVGPDAIRSNESESGYALQYPAGEYRVIIRVDSTGQRLEQMIADAMVPPTEGVTVSSKQTEICRLPAAIVSVSINHPISYSIYMVNENKSVRVMMSREGRDVPESVIESFVKSITCFNQ